MYGQASEHRTQIATLEHELEEVKSFMNHTNVKILRFQDCIRLHEQDKNQQEFVIVGLRD